MEFEEFVERAGGTRGSFLRRAGVAVGSLVRITGARLRPGGASAVNEDPGGGGGGDCSCTRGEVHSIDCTECACCAEPWSCCTVETIVFKKRSNPDFFCSWLTVIYPCNCR